jgi:hypothetical protein
MNALAICLIAAHFISGHVTPINRSVAPCDGDVIVYADNATGGYTVQSPMPRP